MKSISILIPIYNRLAVTKEGLLSLSNTISYYYEHGRHTINYNIIVIDDGSTDGSAEWIIKNYPDVHLLRGDGNLWWSGSINMGARYAIEQLYVDYIILWNDDILVEEKYFVDLEKRLEQDSYPKNVIYGSNIFEYPNVSKTWSNMGYMNKYTGFRNSVQEDINFSSPSLYHWFTGMGTIIPSDVVTNLNYWDDVNFPQYYGDSDFTIRAYKKAYNLILCPDLKIWNKVEFSSFIARSTWKDYFKSLKMKQSRYNIKAEIVFLKRHTLTPFWITFLFYKHVFYLRDFIKNKYKKALT